MAHNYYHSFDVQHSIPLPLSFRTKEEETNRRMSLSMSPLPGTKPPMSSNHNEGEGHRIPLLEESSSSLAAPELQTNITSITTTTAEDDESVFSPILACSHNSILLEQVLFFLAGLGSSIGYIATLSSLVYFKILFGANSFVDLNCAVFLPLLPISVAQAVWDSRFDIVYKSRVTFLVRGIVGYAFVMSGTLGMFRFGLEEQSAFSPGLGWVVFNALQQGIGGAVLFGQLNQLASFVGSLHHDENNNNNNNNSNSNTTEEAELSKKFKATVSAGVQASAVFVLGASILSGFGTMNGDRFATFCLWILYLELICFVASLWLLAARPRIQVSMLRRDERINTTMSSSNDDDNDDDDNEPSELEDFRQLLSPPSGILRQPLLSSPTSTSPELSLRELLYHSRLCCYGMGLTLVPSFLVGSWFTRVQTDWMELAQILFYTRIGSDLTGRFATILVPPTSIVCVVWTAGLRWIAVVLFFLNASQRLPLTANHRDCLSIALVAFIAFNSGYLVTSCYQLAPQQLPGTLETKATNAAKQASLLTVFFSLSAIAGLVSSFVFIALGV